MMPCIAGKAFLEFLIIVICEEQRVLEIYTGMDHIRKNNFYHIIAKPGVDLYHFRSCWTGSFLFAFIWLDFVHLSKDGILQFIEEKISPVIKIVSIRNFMNIEKKIKK